MTPTQRENLRQILRQVPHDILSREMQRRHDMTKATLRPVAKAFHISDLDILSPSQSHAFTEARAAAAAFFRIHHDIPAAQAAAMLRVTRGRLSKWLQRHLDYMKTRPDYARRYQTLSLFSHP